MSRVDMFFEWLWADTGEFVVVKEIIRTALILSIVLGASVADINF